MHPAPEVHVSHSVTHSDAHELSLVTHPCAHVLSPLAQAAAQLCSISAQVPAQLIASIRHDAPHDEPSLAAAASVEGGAASLGLWASVPPLASSPPEPGSGPVLASSPPTGSKTLKSWVQAVAAIPRHATARATAARAIRTLL
jgi:hypothetical protein